MYTIDVLFTIYTLMLNDINIFIKWLALKEFILNKVSNATKIARFMVFPYESYFLLGHLIKVINSVT